MDNESVALELEDDVLNAEILRVPKTDTYENDLCVSSDQRQSGIGVFAPKALMTRGLTALCEGGDKQTSLFASQMDFASLNGLSSTYESNEYSALYVKSNSPMASNCNSDVEDGCEGSDHSDRNRKYKKFTYEDIEKSLSKYYDENEKVGTETDVLMTYLKGVQILYKQSKSITQIKFYLLIMSTLSVAICLSIISPFIHGTEWGAYLITAGNALIATLVAISRYLCLETYITNYAFMQRQYNRLESLLDLDQSREVFSNDADMTVAVPVSLNLTKGLNLQEAEQRMNEIKEFFGELVPEDMIRLFPLIHNTNIFRFIKKMEQYKRNLIIRFRDIKNEIHFILHKWNDHPFDSLSNTMENGNRTPKHAREKNRIIYLMELKEKTKTELLQCKHTYTQMDELFNKEIRYAETHQSCFGCGGWFRPDYDFNELTPALREYLRLVIPD